MASTQTLFYTQICTRLNFLCFFPLREYFLYIIHNSVHYMHIPRYITLNWQNIQREGNQYTANFSFFCWTNISYSLLQHLIWWHSKMNKSVLGKAKVRIHQSPLKFAIPLWWCYLPSNSGLSHHLWNILLSCF